MITDVQWEKLIRKIKSSDSRSKFCLGEAEREYVLGRGLDVLRLHATDFVGKRLAPKEPAHEGKQTPLKGHPVFIAQHATATCCRGWLEKWHGIEKGRVLKKKEIEYVVDVIMRWTEYQLTLPIQTPTGKKKKKE